MVANVPSANTAMTINVTNATATPMAPRSLPCRNYDQMS
jgi:hypothetical protein